MIDRFHGKVKYWIPINEIDSILRHPFSSAGLIRDRFLNENFEKVIYQAMHNQFVAAAAITKYIHETYSDIQVGSMITSTMFIDKIKKQNFSETINRLAKEGKVDEINKLIMSNRKEHSN